MFQYPLNLHYSQTYFAMISALACFNTLWIYTTLKHFFVIINCIRVSIPSEFTLLSNGQAENAHGFQFQYPLNLHYSQTQARVEQERQQFQYPLNLHYSQTRAIVKIALKRFQYPLNLHYSQTRAIDEYKESSFNTLWIYTTLKLSCVNVNDFPVSIPSEFTLLSNLKLVWLTGQQVSIPSEFTLLSNLCVIKKFIYMFQYPLNLHYSQTPLWSAWYYPLFQYPLNLHYSQTQGILVFEEVGFNTLWIYTTLKHSVCIDCLLDCFNTLWIYTTLKPYSWFSLLSSVSIPSEFTLLSNKESNSIKVEKVSIPSEFTLLSNMQK